jgi:phage portal protein BeeE
MGLLDKVRAAREGAGHAERAVTSLDEYAAAVTSYMSGYAGVQQTIGGEPAEKAPNDLTGYASQAYAANGPVFALMAVRGLVFSAVRMAYQRLSSAEMDLFGTRNLAILEEPWPGGTTQDLLSRMLLDADLAGNSYWVREGDELVRLRPDWVEIVLEPRRFRGGTLGYRRIGYVYTEGGPNAGNPVPLLPDEVAHFAPHPDPLATYRGMSWLTPVIRELANDRLMSRHQQKFFENGATPNMIVKYAPEITPEKFEKIRRIINDGHAGAANAYKTLHLGPGADATVVGTNFQQMTFTDTQGRVETRLASAAGVPPVFVGFSEGLKGSSLNEGNFKAARRRFADATMHPLWARAAGALARVMPREGGARLWYDGRQVPFLREDEKDAAEIQGLKARTLRALLDAGCDFKTSLGAVVADDWAALTHSGLFSVQLQKPGETAGSGAAAIEPPADTPDNEGTAQ